MGSSQSHPSSPSNRSQREASPASPRNRSNGLRRFSSLSHSRSSRDGSRRGRRRSPDSKLVDKRPRLAEGIIQDDAASTSASPQAIKPPEVISSADSDPAITQFPAESVISLPPVISPHPPLPGDPLFRDGDRLSSTADDTSSQNGHHSTPSASTSIVRRFRGRSLPLAPAATEESSLSNRLTALLGFSAPAVSRPAPAAHIGEPELGENVNIEELQTRLNRAREDLAETQRMLNETQARIEAANRRQIPQGAVLVIQGLAQTHTLEEDTEAIQRDSPDRELPRPSLRRLRRSSDSNTQRPRAARNDVNGTSLEAQARMIGGLLRWVPSTGSLKTNNPQCCCGSNSDCTLVSHKSATSVYSFHGHQRCREYPLTSTIKSITLITVLCGASSRQLSPYSTPRKPEVGQLADSPSASVGGSD